MIDKGEVDPTLLPIASLADIAERSSKLATEIEVYAEALGGASLAAMLEVNPTLAETDLADDWPIQPWSLRSLFCDEIKKQLIEHKEGTPNAISVASLAGRKLSLDTLTDAYPNADSPKLSFVVDLIKWANLLHSKGHSVLVEIEYIGEGEERLEYSIFEDVEIARDWLQSRTDGGMDDPDDQPSDPYVWVGDRAIVKGSAEQITAITSALQSSVV